MSSTAWDYFEGVPRVSLDFGGHSGAQGKGSPPLRFCLGRRALSQKIQGVKSLQVLQESPPTPKFTWPENETH